MILVYTVNSNIFNIKNTTVHKPRLDLRIITQVVKFKHQYFDYWQCLCPASICRIWESHFAGLPSYQVKQNPNTIVQ